MSYKDNEVIMQRNIADYIAGMTDRFAEQLASKYL
jgi:dGTP triphosphohydrolase